MNSNVYYNDDYYNDVIPDLLDNYKSLHNTYIKFSNKEIKLTDFQVDEILEEMDYIWKNLTDDEKEYLRQYCSNK